MNQVLCRTIDGRTVPIAKDRLTFRAAVYALVVNDGKLLILNTRSTGTFLLPGGGVEVGGPLLDGLELAAAFLCHLTQGLSGHQNGLGNVI